jgi:hypothetical protein
MGLATLVIVGVKMSYDDLGASGVRLRLRCSNRRLIPRNPNGQGRGVGNLKPSVSPSAPRRRTLPNHPRAYYRRLGFWPPLPPKRSTPARELDVQ